MNEHSRDQAQNAQCQSRYTLLRRKGLRSTVLFTNFFLIVMAQYQLKPASRSIFIEALGADMLPYLWIGTALTMIVSIRFYNQLVERYSRLNVVIGTCIFVVGMLTLFRALLAAPTPAVAAAFYIFVDIIAVVMVEQFWCLTDSIFTPDEGRSWYGFIGTGGLVGGMVSGVFGAVLIKETHLQTADLLLVADVIITAILGVTWVMGASGVYCETENPTARSHAAGDLQTILGSRYLTLLAAMLLLGQMAAQFVEFQFFKSIEASLPEREARTAYLSMFFSVMSGVAIGVNLLLTPLIHRFTGALTGLLVQPLLLAACSAVYFLNPTLLVGSALKISDRGLSYSINRASRELLYVPISPVVIYQAKAWIDMFGYRLFDACGSMVIILFKQWHLFTGNAHYLSVATIGVCLLWMGMVAMLRKEYVEITSPDRQGD